MADLITSLNETSNDGKLYGFQLLEECTTQAKGASNKYTEITFMTNQVNTSELALGEGKLGIVVWVDREEFRTQANK